MVNMFTLRVIDRGLSPNQVNPKTKICICYFSAKHGALSELKTGWPRIRIICASGATFLTCGRLLSQGDYTKKIPIKLVDIVQNGHQHLIEMLLVL